MDVQGDRTGFITLLILVGCVQISLRVAGVIGHPQRHRSSCNSNLINITEDKHKLLFFKQCKRKNMQSYLLQLEHLPVRMEFSNQLFQAFLCKQFIVLTLKCLQQRSRVICNLKYPYLMACFFQFSNICTQCFRKGNSKKVKSMETLMFLHTPFSLSRGEKR